jgi:hypothetical protein
MLFCRVERPWWRYTTLYCHRGDVTMIGYSQARFIDAIVQFVAVPFDSDTHKRLLYLLIACPLALTYFIGTTAGLAVGIGLSVTLVGLPILLITLLGVTSAAWLEAYLARTFLDRESSTPVSLTGLRMDIQDSDIRYLTALKRFLIDPSTWTSLALVAVKSVFGLIAFVALVTLCSVVATLIAAPVLYDNPEAAYQIFNHSIDTLPTSVGLSAVGILLGLIALHLLNAFATLGGYLTKSLLSVGQPQRE